MHSSSLTSPVRGEEVPGGQSVHSVSPGWLEYLPAGQIRQLVSSFSADSYLPRGQIEQEASSENGFIFGEDMNLPAGQHPYRAVLEPR